MYIEWFLDRAIIHIVGLLNLIGVLIITLASIKVIISLIRSRFNFKQEGKKIEFAQALSLALEFKLAAEILMTVVIRTLDEFIILAAVTLFRIIIGIVIHWESEAKEKKQLAETNTKASK